MSALDDVFLRPAPADAVAELEGEGFAPLAARVFAARGIRQGAEISPPIKTLPPAEQLAGVEEMAAALAKVCASDAPLCIVGDYDADGVTSTTIAYECLCRLGANACWHIPSRYDNGYGLTPAIVEAQAAHGIKHILTVDNGTSAHAAIARAHKLGITMYVVDHHQPDDAPIRADYLVNPQVTDGAGSAFSNLVGVGLTFYLMAQLRRVMGADICMADYLDLVAIGTVADCGEMDAMNRTLVAGGMARLRAGRTRPGVLALAASSKVAVPMMSSRDIGFRMAPRINAAGRMGSADAAMHCLLAEDPTVAREYAEELEALNRKRLLQQEETYIAALQNADGDRHGIVVGEAHWPSGIVGIIAGKIAEHFSRPTIALHRLPEGDWRGSGRAAGQVDLIAVLRAVEEAHPGMLLNYGGHRQAAGVNVKGDCFEAFADAFDAACANVHHPSTPLLVDALSPEGITREALEQMEAAPWGQGFAAPTFAGKFSVLRTELTRGGFLRFSLKHAESSATFAAVNFNCSEWGDDEIAAVYTAGISSYNNELQLIIHAVLPHAGAGA